MVVLGPPKRRLEELKKLQAGLSSALDGSGFIELNEAGWPKFMETLEYSSNRDECMFKKNFIILSRITLRIIFNLVYQNVI